MEAFFLDSYPGRRFCVFHPPSTGLSASTAILYLHPFAEELNRSRRMAARQSRMLAEIGCAVLQIDLYGCGDSDGEFGDASWEHWQRDSREAIRWLRKRCEAPLWIWGLRAGALLAADVLQESTDVAGLLLWQPQLSGKDTLRQFLRIKMAQGMLTGDPGAATERLDKRLANGESIEIAGYMLSPALAMGLRAAELNLPHRPLRIECLEVVPFPDSASNPTLSARLAKWRDEGHRVRKTKVVGAQFWQMAEPEDLPALLEETRASLVAPEF